jgi:ATP-dependent exoDNAse (exonuclease V) beta subunit
MTVHQAKGLEFDAVVLPDLDFRLDQSAARTFLLGLRRSPLEDASRVMRAPAQQISALDPRRKEIVDRDTEGQVTEALSVLYVALTRARQGLYLVAASKAPSASAAKRKETEEPGASYSYAGIICAALGIAHDGSGTVFEKGNSAWYAEKKERTPPPKVRSAAAAKIALAPAGGHSRLLPLRSPSELEGGETIDLALALDFARHGSSGRGLLLHRFFEQIEWLDGGIPEDAALRDAARTNGLFSDSEITNGIGEFKEMLALEKIRALFMRESFRAEALEVWRERRFAVRLDDIILSGTFDRVVLEKKGGKILAAHLYDFKTDRVNGARAVSERATYYGPQIDAYRRAIEKLTALPAERIATSLVFVSAGTVVEKKR